MTEGAENQGLNLGKKGGKIGRFSTGFGKWSAQVEKFQGRIGRGENVENSRIVLPKDKKPVMPTYDGRWDAWYHGRERLEIGKNTAYACAEETLKCALANRDTRGIEDVVSRYSNFFSLFEDFGIKENRVFAYIGVAGILAEQRVLDFLVNNGDPQNISYRLASRIQAEYLDALADIVEEALEAPSTYDSKQIPPQMAPFIIEAALEANNQLSHRLDSYESFRVNEKSPSKKLKQVQERLEQLRRELVELARSVTIKSRLLEDKGWVFYTTTDRWPIDDIERVVSSHAPDFNWDAYFKGRGHWTKAGICLIGKDIRHFSSDMAASLEELQLWSDWTFEEGCELQASDLVVRARRRGENLSRREAIEQQQEMFGHQVCRSCQEAWEKKMGNDYTEIWLEDPVAYAIWIPVNWKEEILSYFGASDLKWLLESRPDLPIILQETGEVVSRDTVAVWIKQFTERKEFDTMSDKVRLYPEGSNSKTEDKEGLPTREIILLYQPEAEWYLLDPESVHGRGHAARTLILAEKIALKYQREFGYQIDFEALRWAAVLHDIRRESEVGDKNHGLRAARWVRENLAAISHDSVDVEKVAYLCQWHDAKDDKIPNMTPELMILKDADGLELWRTGVEPDLKILRTEFARNLVETAFAFCADCYAVETKNSYLTAVDVAEKLGLIK